MNQTKWFLETPLTVLERFKWPALFAQCQKKCLVSVKMIQCLSLW